MLKEKIEFIFGFTTYKPVFKSKLNLMTFLFVSTFAQFVFANEDVSESKSVKNISAEQKQNIQIAKDSQVKVDQLSDETQALRDEYRQVLKAIENSKIYNQQVRDLIEGQKVEMAKINLDVENIKDTTRKITPLMAKMKDSLTEFVTYDLPFFKEERAKRMADLKELFVTSGVSVSEKYRKVLEAYLIESEYGQTLEAYKDSVELDGNKVSADFLKVGRIGLYYLTKDGKKGGIWDLKKQGWIELDSSQRSLVGKAVKMAMKQASPSLLIIPVIKSIDVAVRKSAHKEIK